jgi:type II secretory pathway pseudopilin PulG
MTHGRNCAEGFTFVETLVSVVVLALVLAAAAPIAQAAVRSLWTLAREEVRLHAIARAYDAFRSACDDTIVPPWVSSASASSPSSGGYRVAYLGGSEDDSWTLAAGDDGLLVETPRGRIEVPARRARVERIESGGRTIGLGASFESLGKTWAWKGYFGAAGY